MLTHYNPDYYSYYCCYQFIAQNWLATAKNRFPHRSNSVLKNFDLRLQPISVTCKNEFIGGIQESIDKDSPMLMIPLYNTMFYSIFYKDTDAYMSHGLIISGYNSDKDLVMLQENVHITEYNNLGTVGTPFFTFALPTDMLFNIWKDSIAQHASDEDILFEIIRINKNIPMLSRLDVLKYYANLNLSDENTFVNSLKDLRLR